MKRTLLFLLSLAIITAIHAQEVQIKKTAPDLPYDGGNKFVLDSDPNHVYDMAQQEPEFPGGAKKFINYISANLRYPSVARDNKVQGRVFVKFIVEKNGLLSHIRILRGLGSGCDQEAIRLVKGSSKWKPGYINGKLVRAEYIVPIEFKL